MKMDLRCFFKITAFVCCMFVGKSMSAQVVLPPAYSQGIPVNYVRTWDVMSPQTDPLLLMTKPVKEVKQSTQYVDGLGRPLQTVVKQGSLISGGSPVDMVQATYYDAFGRETLQYLPFAANTIDGSTSVNDGNFKGLHPFLQQQHFYSDANATSPVKGQGDTYYYSKTDLEFSPLNRPAKTYAPGNSWVGASRNIETRYHSNTSTDDVRIWTVTNNATAGQFGSYSSSGAYEANELFKTITIDEHNKQVIEFKDKEGQVILKKVQLTAADDNGTGSGHTGWMCTYYIYDDLNQLRAVIQPNAVDILRSNGWDLTNATLLLEQTFRYEYDSRNRMIAKQVPGALPVYMVYDKWDRLVLTQNGGQRGGRQWIYHKYDQLNRLIVLGIYIHATIIDQPTMQAVVDGSTVERYELFTPRTTQPQYTLDRTFPTVAVSTVYTANYYDSYDWTTNLNASFKFRITTWDNDLQSQNLASYPEPLTQSLQTTGLQTGVWNNVLTYSSYIYDDKGRVIQTQTKTLAGTDVSTTLYCFNGSMAVSVLQQQNTRNPQTHEIWTRQTYDDLWRVTKTEKRLRSTLVNANAYGDWKTTVQNTYNALGQLETKQVGTKSTGGALAKSDNVYNIRGWLLSVNKKFITNEDNTDRYFGMELGYDKSGSQSFNSAQFNGNIAGAIWKSKGDQAVRKYDYGYDVANRLLKADFSDPSGGMNFNVSLGNGSDPNQAYDYNGNIKKMKQQGWYAGNPSAVIDDLTYSYLSYSNRLYKVVDAVTNDNKLGDFTDRFSGTDYNYDGNGNLTADRNKLIVPIQYNFLNLPTSIIVKKDASLLVNKGIITFTYEANGTKLKKVVTEEDVQVKHNGVDYVTDIVTTTSYLSGAVYESKDYVSGPNELDYPDKLLYLVHEEGRIRLEEATTSTCPEQTDRFVFDYFLKDHLGGTRAVLSEQTENICYPGATMETATVAAEKQVFSIEDARIRDKSVVNGASSYPQFQEKLYEVHGGLTNQKTGLAVILKVMAGDKVQFKVSSIYTLPAGGNTGGPLTVGLTELLTSLAGSTLAGGKGMSQSILESLNPMGTLSSLNNQRSQTTTRPQAYLNYMFFDDQFKYTQGAVAPVNAGSGTTPVYTEINNFFNSPVTAQKNGYIYIFVSNESNIPVFFDNLLVTHTPGPILEETHYYPFGLAMEGINSKAIEKLENKIKYNGIEFDNDLSLEVYTAFFRNLDPQIGKWWQVDPKIENMEGWSPYASNFDNPILFSDRLGDEPDGSNPPSGTCCGVGVGTLVKIFETTEKAANNALESVRKGLVSAGGVLSGYVGLPTDMYSQFTGENTLTESDQEINSSSHRMGQTAALLNPFLVNTSSPGVQLVNGPKITLPLLLPVPLVPITLVSANKKSYGSAGGSEHTRGARASTKKKHQDGMARKAKDRNGSKGMKRPPLRRPKGHSGPWPPR
ncbi:DUF6443 domain-containing protein [Flavihumibacter solisilvae]|nr:DUF6443 domain-containing protein [Flavihumibacter solisilvae]